MIGLVISLGEMKKKTKDVYPRGLDKRVSRLATWKHDSLKLILLIQESRTQLYSCEVRPRLQEKSGKIQIVRL